MQHLYSTSIWYYIVCFYCNLYGQAGACIPVASVSQIHVAPIQCVLLRAISIYQISKYKLDY